MAPYKISPSPVAALSAPSLDLVLQPLTFPNIITPYGIAVLIAVSTLVEKMQGGLAGLILILLAIMGLNLLAMLYAEQLLVIICPATLQLLGLLLTILQLVLGLTLIIYAIELEALVLRRLLA